MSDDAPGDSLANRLMARNNTPALHRVSMTDGSEAFSGELANRALRTLGARAFTVDRSIVVHTSFDQNKAEDAALFGHELFHQEQAKSKSGDGDGASHDGADAEEHAARAVERMVLHRANAGEDFSTLMRDAKAGGGGAGGEGGADDPSKAKVSSSVIGGDKDRDPMEAYKQLLAEGRTHNQIVGMLKDFVVQTLDRLNEEHSFRSTEHDFFG